MVCWFGLRPKVFTINPLGVSVEFFGYNGKKGKEKIFVYFAGPLINIFMGIIFLFISMNEELKMKIVYTNFILAMFNLIPIMPLDGGKILKEILLINIGNKDASIFMNKVTQVILVIITVLYSVLILKMKNFAIFLLILYLWYLKYVEDRKLKTLIKAYDTIEKTL